MNNIIGKEATGWLLFIIDTCVVLTSFSFVYFLHFGLFESLDHLFQKLPIVLVLSVLSFGLIVNYKRTGHFFTDQLFFRVQVASLVQAILIYGITLIEKYLGVFEFNISLGFVVFYLVFNSSLLILVRMLLEKIRKDQEIGNINIPKVLLFDDPEKGIESHNNMQSTLSHSFELLGIVNEIPSQKNIKGIPVFEMKEVTQDFLKKYKVDYLVFSKRNLASSQLISILNFLANCANDIKIKAFKNQDNQQKVHIDQLDILKMGNLIDRATIELDNPLCKQEYEGKVIMITGAAGSIGSEIAKQILNFNCKQLVLVDQAESELYNLQQYFQFKNRTEVKTIVGDIRNYERMNQLLTKYQPQIVFHAAAYKHVPFMEISPIESVEVNLLGTKNMADLSVKHGVEKFVFVSTDKAVNPTSVMGATKRLAELYLKGVERKATKIMITRFGNVIGSNGSVIPLFQSQIDQGGPITLTNKEIRRFFMTIPQACQLVMEAGARGKGSEVFVFDMGAPIKIVDLALYMIRISGLKYPEDIDIEITGLRPGEKMEEELLVNDEQAIFLENKNILLVESSKNVDPEMIDQVNNLCDGLRNYSQENLVKKLREILPEFSIK